MKLLKEHIIFKCITLLLVCFLLTPSFVKLGHVFENHKHEICIEKQNTHIHALDLDCEFYKFKVNNNFTLNVLTFNLLTLELHPKVYTSQYHFISDYQRLPYALRGPPQLI